MMSWFNKINHVDTSDKDRRIEELEREIDRYSEALARERTNIEEFKQTIVNVARESTFSFDFKAVKVFSIERNIKNQLPCTIIGYLLPEPVVVTEGNTTTKEVVREWYLYCSDTQHEQLVKEFKESRK